MDDVRDKLIALALDDLSPREASVVGARMSEDPDLQREHAQLVYTLTALRSVPSDDIREEAIERLLGTVSEIGAESHDPVPVADEPDPAPAGRLINLDYRFFMRAAAVAAVAFVLGAGIMFTPDVELAPTVARVSGPDGYSFVLDGELVEARAGSPRTITFPTGEVLLDGASGVRVIGTGRHTPPRLEVERGRMMLNASRHDMSVSVAGTEVLVERGGMLAVSYDRAYANIAPDGSLVEVQRMPIADVAAMAEAAYGFELDISRVPDAIARQRVTFYGAGLSRDEFLDSFVEAASQFGVKLSDDRATLQYEKRGGRVVPNEAWALEIAVLEGSAHVRGPEGEVSLQQQDEAPNVVVLNAAQPNQLQPRTLEPRDLNDAVVWVAAAGRRLGGRLDDVRPSAETLPGGSVIHSDTLVLNGEMGRRIFRLDGPEFDFPLPGGRKGRLVQLLNNGALFEVEGEVVREFVPFGKQ
jgi:hypothetical protein